VVIQYPEMTKDDMPSAAQNWGRGAAFLFVVPGCNSAVHCWLVVLLDAYGCIIAADFVL